MIEDEPMIRGIVVQIAESYQAAHLKVSMQQKVLIHCSGR